jgi:hypothetical protein
VGVTFGYSAQNEWRENVDYIELNKANRKDHFPLSLIDQVIDALSSKQYFLLDGFGRYNKIEIILENQDKTSFTCPWGTFSYKVLPFGFCKALVTF